MLDAIAGALQLDEAERAHLFDLARAAGPGRTRRRSAPKQVRPSVQRILDAMTHAPALVQNGRLDILAANRLGRALYSQLYLEPTRPINHARFTFLDRRAHDLYPDWDRAANLTLTFEMMELAADPGLSLLAYSAEPGSRSEAALNLLGSWAATAEQEHAAGATPQA